jgi:RHS repeat-associated protein
MDDPITSETTEGFGLMFFNARWLDPQLGRFAQADSIVPGGVQGLDRYAYVNNNPLRYTDPTGHMCREGSKECDGADKVGDKSHGGGYCTNPFSCANGEHYTRTPRPHSSTYPILSAPTISQFPQAGAYPNSQSPIGKYIQALSLTIGYIDDVSTVSPLIYRKAFTWGKAFNPNPGLDAALGAIGQGLDDSFNSPNLSIPQRIERVFIAGGESFLTGLASEGIAAVVGLGTMNPIVFGGAQVFSSVVIDYGFWPAYNHEYFGAAGY